MTKPTAPKASKKKDKVAPEVAAVAAAVAAAVGKEEKEENQELVGKEENQELTESENKMKKKAEKKTEKKAETNPAKPDSNLLVKLLFGVLMLLGVGYYLTLSAAQTRRLHRTGQDTVKFWPYLQSESEAKNALGEFFTNLAKTNTMVLRAAVLQMETTSGEMDHLLTVVRDNIKDKFGVVEIDASAALTAKLESNFFTKFPTQQSIVVLVTHADKATSKFLLSLCGRMENPVLVDEDSGVQREAQTVGFLFVGSSLSREACDATMLLEHNEQVLQWPRSFITRLTEQVKICGGHKVLEEEDVVEIM